MIPTLSYLHSFRVASELPVTPIPSAATVEKKRFVNCVPIMSTSLFIPLRVNNCFTKKKDFSIIQRATRQHKDNPRVCWGSSPTTLATSNYEIFCHHITKSFWSQNHWCDAPRGELPNLLFTIHTSLKKPQSARSSSDVWRGQEKVLNARVSTCTGVNIHLCWRGY